MNGYDPNCCRRCPVVAALVQLLYALRMNKEDIFSIDRIELLQTLLKIVDSGSLSAAARQLGTSQPTVSRRLKSLEQLLGCRLLHRSTHQLQLTEQGEHCYQQARELTLRWQALTDQLQNVDGQLKGLLRVRAPHAFGRDQLLKPLLSYLHQWPALSIDWQLNDRTPDFLSEALDCAIHVGPLQQSNVVAVKLAEVPRIVVAAPQLLATLTTSQQQELFCDTTLPAVLAQLPWLAFSTYYRDTLLLERPASADLAPAQLQLALTPRFLSDNLYAVREAALAGLGAAVVSQWVVREDLAAGTLVRLCQSWQAAPLPIYLLYPHAPYYPARLRHFIDFIKEVLPKIAGVAPS